MVGEDVVAREGMLKICTESTESAEEMTLSQGRAYSACRSATGNGTAATFRRGGGGFRG